MAEYELSRHRYKELKHFCLQYHLWEKELARSPLEEKLDIENAMQLIEKTARDTSAVYAPWILKHATDDLSYSAVRPPCDNKTFEYYIHKFYWLLSHRRGV